MNLQNMRISDLVDRWSTQKVQTYMSYLVLVLLFIPSISWVNNGLTQFFIYHPLFTWMVDSRGVLTQYSLITSIILHLPLILTIYLALKLAYHTQNTTSIVSDGKGNIGAVRDSDKSTQKLTSYILILCVVQLIMYWMYSSYMVVSSAFVLITPLYLVVPLLGLNIMIHYFSSGV